jgi:ATP-dependent Lon protease
MFIGVWDENVKYNRGSIVYTNYINKYYICTKSHISNNLTFPSHEDVYWIQICTKFVDSLNKNLYYGRYGQYYPNVNYIDYSQGNANDENVNDGNVNDGNVNDENVNGENINKDNGQDSIDKEDVSNLYGISFLDEYLKLYDNRQNKKSKKKLNFKRSLEICENDLMEHRKKKFKSDNIDNLRDRLMMMNIDIDTKDFIIDKYESSKKMSNSDYAKTITWLKTVSKIPFGNYKRFSVTKNDNSEVLKGFFESVKSKLDNIIYGLDDVKQEILEFVAKKITNPDSKGHVLALCGNAGLGKTKIIKTLAEALSLPFYQINFGGLNDVSVLTGHSETYIGSKPGKIVEIFTNCNYMNPIIYLDELDKISESKAVEIFGVLTHLLDEEQNNKFQDNYLSHVSIDLSNVFFVLAFNDISKIDSIVSDRLKVIYIDPPNLNDKIIICQDKMIPDILKSIKLKDNIQVTFSKEIIEYIIITKTQAESGVRQLKKNIEKILNRLNYDLLIGNLHDIKIETNIKYKDDSENSIDTDSKNIIITRSYVDNIIKYEKEHENYSHMYI